MSYSNKNGVIWGDEFRYMFDKKELMPIVIYDSEEFSFHVEEQRLCEEVFDEL